MTENQELETRRWIYSFIFACSKQNDDIGTLTVLRGLKTLDRGGGTISSRVKRRHVKTVDAVRVQVGQSSSGFIGAEGLGPLVTVMRGVSV